MTINKGIILNLKKKNNNNNYYYYNKTCDQFLSKDIHDLPYVCDFAVNKKNQQLHMYHSTKKLFMIRGDLIDLFVECTVYSTER